MFIWNATHLWPSVLSILFSIPIEINYNEFDILMESFILGPDKWNDINWICNLTSFLIYYNDTP